MQLILASTSPYRRALIERLGLACQAVPPPFEELRPGEIADPAELVATNALGKAGSLCERYPEALIIGSDQVAVCEDEVLLKPGTESRAIEQLGRLAGREHTLMTAVTVIGASTGRAESACAINRMRMRPLSSEEIRAYVARERPVDCAGAYKSEGLGIALFEYLRGDDPTAIIGLPLIALGDLLSRFGVNPLLEGCP